MKRKGFTILILIALIVGASLLLYPTVSNYWNSFHQTRAIAGYTEAVEDLNDDDYREMWQACQAYNAQIPPGRHILYLTNEQLAQYNALLDVSGTGIMCYVEIPAINCRLPVYHGTDEGVLQIAVGHLEWSSLPVGGPGTHCVISGHRGLPSAKLLTNLNRLVEGDTFTLYVLDEILTYEVDQIRIVLPEETDDLLIEEGEDYCTVVTCTPYGINTHRLLVRGHRIDNTAETEGFRVPADAVKLDPVVVAPAIAVPILIIIFIVLFLCKNKGGTRKGGKQHET